MTSARNFLLFEKLFAESKLAHSVSLHDSIVKLYGLNIAREGMDSFAGDTSVFGNGLYLLGGGNADLFKSYRQTYLDAEVLNFLELLFGRALENELNKRAESYAAAMVGVLDAQRCNAIVERVCSGAVDVISANSREINVSLDDIFEGGGNGVNFASFNSLLAILAKGIVAKSCERLTCTSDARALKAGRLGADRSSALEICTQRVAHARDKELNGSVCDNGSVYHYGVGVSWVEKVFIKAVVVIINYRKTCAGGVGSGNGRQDNDVFAGVVSRSLSGIDSASAAYRNNGIYLVFLNDSLHLSDLALAGDTAEDLVTSVIIERAEAFLYLIMTGFIAAV